MATFFERYAGSFDSIYGHTEKRNAFGRLIDYLFRRTMFLRFKETMQYADNPSIKSIIDIGCGPGHYCVEFLKKNKKVTGLDLSEEMLKIARQHVDFEDCGRALRIGALGGVVGLHAHDVE